MHIYIYAYPHSSLATTIRICDIPAISLDLRNRVAGPCPDSQDSQRLDQSMACGFSSYSFVVTKDINPTYLSIYLSIHLSIRSPIHPKCAYHIEK